MRQPDGANSFQRDIENAFKITGIIALSIIGGWVGWAVIARALAS